MEFTIESKPLNIMTVNYQHVDTENKMPAKNLIHSGLLKMKR